jgi:hypothetical protein
MLILPRNVLRLTLHLKLQSSSCFKAFAAFHVARVMRSFMLRPMLRYIDHQVQSTFHTAFITEAMQLCAKCIWSKSLADMQALPG